MNSLKVSLRNAYRNKRRSITTTLTVSIGTIALCLFGGFVNTVYHGVETGIVRSVGQLHIHTTGYFDFGSGKPTEYDIENYHHIINLIQADTILSKLVRVVTPSLSVGGIAGNYAEQSSQTFIGTGLVPSDRHKMRSWDPYNISDAGTAFPLTDDDNSGVVGSGLARALNLCDELNVSNCTDSVTPESQGEVDADMISMQELDDEQTDNTSDMRASLDLLAASANGAPNVIRLSIKGVEALKQKAIDDRYIAMPLDIAQRLVYGNDQGRVTTISIQLHDSADTDVAQMALDNLFRTHQLDLEVKNLNEFASSYPRVTAMFSTIFGFISAVIAVVVLFTIVNNLSMSVMERCNEIGTLRSIGLRRSGVRKQFLLEGALLGFVGATLGLALGASIAFMINQSGITWTPPSNTNPQRLVLDLFADFKIPLGIWAGLVAVTALASLPPANRAAKMPIVDALRHT